ncbi:MAG: flagellar basal body-associated FliL family protein [Pseudomonadota bacterium]|nr:flagellar basal body-associated FliL family protein [Pseudomonadota bacterium]
MSAAAPTLDAGAPAPVKKGKKKLIILIAMVVLLLVLVGGAAVFLLKKKAASEADGADDATPAVAHESAKPDLKHPPTFLPLDPFVVNLADKDADRYAQVGLTFEVADAHFADEMKAFMPAIRNGILMILSHKSSKDLLDRAGKEQLAAEILRDSSRTMGLEVDDADEPPARADADKPAADDAPVKPVKAKKKKAAPSEPNPIKHVHFSNFIVQ